MSEQAPSSLLPPLVIYFQNLWQAAVTVVDQASLTEKRLDPVK